MLLKIKSLREHNNKNWFVLVRLIFKCNPILSRSLINNKKNITTKEDNKFAKVKRNRLNNKLNLMNALRIGFKSYPKETKIILRKINSCDKKINKLLKDFINEKKKRKL